MPTFSRSACILGATVMALAALASADQTKQATGFRASAVKVDITPGEPKWLSGYQARQSDGVLDPIYHRVAAFDDGVTPFFLISSDLCLFSPSLYDSTTADLRKETGIDPKHVLWTVTHTHAAPEVGPPDMYKALLGRSDHEWDREYTARTTRALIDAVRRAKETLEPARIAFGTGVSLANINRRAMDVDGRVSLGLNPDGPVDRQFNLIRLKQARRQPDRAGCELRDARHGDERAESQDQRRRARNRRDLPRGKARRHGAVRQRRCRQCRANLFRLSEPAERSPLAVQGAARGSHSRRTALLGTRHRRRHDSPRGEDGRHAAQTRHHVAREFVRLRRQRRTSAGPASRCASSE